MYYEKLLSIFIKLFIKELIMMTSYNHKKYELLLQKIAEHNGQSNYYFTLLQKKKEMEYYKDWLLYTNLGIDVELKYKED